MIIIQALFLINPGGSPPSSAPRYADAENLRLFLEEYPETTAALLIHAGQEVKHLGEQILALPWTALQAHDHPHASPE